MKNQTYILIWPNKIVRFQGEKRNISHLQGQINIHKITKKEKKIDN